MDIAKRFDEYLVEVDKKEKAERKVGVISPSSLGQCYRRQFWTRQGVEPSNPIDLETLRVFAIGKYVHRAIQSALGEVACEVEARIGDDVYGHADVVTEDEVIDIKSCGTFQFKKFEKMTAEQFAEEKPDYVLQVMCYAFALNKAIGRIALVSKESGAILSFPFLLKNHSQALQQELAVLRDAWAQGLTPSAKPRLYPQKDGTCREGDYCPFRTKCWNIEGKKCTDGKPFAEAF